MTTAELTRRAGSRMSVDEFLDLPESDDGFQVELDDGELYVMPRPRRVHQFLKDCLVSCFSNYLDGFTEPPAEMYSELVVILSRGSRRVVVPDLAAVLAEHAGILVGGYAEGSPDIVVEILATDRARDLVFKRRICAEAGVREYWVFDPRNDTALPLELRGDGYVARAMLGVGDVLTTPLLPGLAIPLGDIFRHRRRPARDE